MIKNIRRNGIVGAGGAGFPTYAKIKPPIDYLLINGAECEPLLHKDKELLKHYGDEVLRGAARVRDEVGAQEAVLGIKEKYHDIIDDLNTRLPDRVRIAPLGDYYPAGDEFVLVYEITKRVIPRGGLPLHVGCLVMNVETVLNIEWGCPVTHKFLTVGGAVANPSTIKVPIGITVREAIDACGGATVQPFRVLSGGVMMGRLVQDIEQPITKTTGGLLVFPADHALIGRYSRDLKSMNRIGKSACDQCSFCTELCPRYLLGHPIEPHKAMRSLVYSQDRTAWTLGSSFCCECNLCSLIACPEDLDPKDVCAQNKRELRENKLSYPASIPDQPVHFMREGRRTPLKRLYSKLDLNRFTNTGPLLIPELQLERVVVLLKQHVGAPASPIVKTGDRVRVGDVLADVAEKDLGVPIHASMDGRIGSITDTSIEIVRG